MKDFLLALRNWILKYFKTTYPYVILMIIVLIPAFIYQPIFGGLALLALAYLISRDVSLHEERVEEETTSEKREEEELKSVTAHAIFNMPYPMAMLNSNGVITWQNDPFSKILGEIPRNAKINEMIPAINISEFEKEQDDFTFTFKDRMYKGYTDKILRNGEVERYVLYMSDITEYNNLKKLYTKEGLVALYLFVDNLDEVKGLGDESYRAKVQSVIDTGITNYFSEYNGFVRKYEPDKFLIGLDRENFNKIKNKKFDILDKVREIEVGNTIPITLSIGVSDIGETPLQKYGKARSALDIALGRGGDQAVVVLENGYDYFGGKTKAVQKRTKVKARVIGYALKELIKEANNIYISGHKNPDMDSIGSAVGMMAVVQLMGKSASLVLGNDTVAISNIMDLMKEESPDIYKSIVTPEEALRNYKKGDLLILTDHHKPSLSPSEELSETADNIVVIDHHRRADEFVKNPSLVYLEPHASSASELVSEILQYIIEDKKLSHFESSALMAGIMLDTKNFTVQTGIRTFEAAGLLVRMGADPEEVKLLFRDDYNTFINKAKATETTELYNDKYAIASVGNSPSAILTAAQVADDLLTIDGVKASFVLADVGETETHLSARSIGDVNVQLIAEALGGGGHLAQAGARLELDLEKSKESLKNAIDNYEKEN